MNDSTKHIASEGGHAAEEKHPMEEHNPRKRWDAAGTGAAAGRGRDADPAPAGLRAYGPAPDVHDRRPVFGTIFWGVLLLIFAVVMAALTIPAVHIDPVALTIGAFVAMGVLLVVAGISASLRRPRR